MAEIPAPADRLKDPAAFLTRSDLATLGLTRTAVDYVFRVCPTVHFARCLLCSWEPAACAWSASSDRSQTGNCNPSGTVSRESE